MKKSSLKSLTSALVLRQNGLSTMTAALRHWVHAILPLSSSPRSTRMFLRGIMCCALVVVCVACKSPSVTTPTNATQHFVVQHTHDTVIVRDSIFVREYMQGDTIFRDRIEWRDRWRTQIVHDTILRTDSIVRVVEHPPERYIPKFHKTCTWIFWVILVGSILIVILRWKISR